MRLKRRKLGRKELFNEFLEKTIVVKIVKIEQTSAESQLQSCLHLSFLAEKFVGRKSQAKSQQKSKNTKKNEIKMKPEASPLQVSCKLISVLQFLFLLPLKLLCARLLDDSEVELIAEAQLSVGNRAFQEVLSYQGADDQGGVAVRASNRACGDVGFKGCKSNFIILFLFGGSDGNSG